MNQNQNQNPLAQYFRKPGVHVKLPTNGAFLPEVDFTMNNEVPVFPMRSADELLLKSPDALMSGYAVENLMKSCVPAIHHPRLISSCDLDVLFLAIRAATYGETIDLSLMCPNCSYINDVQQNLSYMMSTITYVDPENPVRLTDEILVYLRPYNMENAASLGIASFEETRAVQGAEQESPEAKTKQLNKSMDRLSNLVTDILADCVLKVVVPEGEVTDKLMVREFIRNISKEWTDRIQKKIEEMNKKGIDRTYDVVCSSCHHEWKSEVEFDPSTFFAASSSV